MIPIEFAELAAPLFLAGTNLKQKLHSTTVKMLLDDEANRLIVLYNGKVAFISTNACVSITPTDSTPYLKLFDKVQIAKPKSTNLSHAKTLNISRAQVSDPSTVVQNPRKDLGQ